MDAAYTAELQGTTAPPVPKLLKEETHQWVGDSDGSSFLDFFPCLPSHAIHITFLR